MKDIITQLAVSKISTVGSETGATATNAINGVLNAVIGVLGLVCVIVMIVGGVKYMTSTGDPGKVKAAKDTILYGLIGLIVCALAFAIVNFVINAINNS